jgi:lambda family phage minor tail protein L
MTTIRSDIQKLELDAVVELYRIDSPSRSTVTPQSWFYHDGLNGKKLPLVWRGQTYSPFPIQATGFASNGSGKLPRPTVQIANIGGAMTDAMAPYGDFSGAKFTRIMTIYKYMDAVNFPGSVNPTEDQTQEFPREVWFFDKKSNEDDIFMTYELCSAFDLPFTMLPARQVLPMCGYLYRDADCGYTGGPVADGNDVPTSNPLLDKCSLKISGCKMRFGENAELPFGGEPVVGLTRM